MRDYKTIQQKFLRDIRNIRRINNHFGVPRKKLPLTRFTDPTRKQVTVSERIGNFNAWTPRHLVYMHKRGSADQLRTAYQIGLMQGIITSMLDEARHRESNPCPTSTV